MKFKQIDGNFAINENGDLFYLLIDKKLHSTYSPNPSEVKSVKVRIIPVEEVTDVK